MKQLIIPIIFLIAACGQSVNQDNVAKVDSIKYPLLIDSGEKIVYKRGRMTPGIGKEVYLDTVIFTKGQIYQKDSLRHPLLQFYLSYPEWKTIKCIISVDERDYWDKAMIALIEKTGTLRISYKARTLRLTPTVPIKVDKGGELSGTFKNDSLEIQISGQLKSGGAESLRGQGNLIFRTPTKTVNETIFLVYEIK